MIGAIIGDISGSKYEFNNIKSKDFNIFDQDCKFTDDTVLTCAVAKSILDCDGEYSNLDQMVIKNFREFVKKYPNAGYSDTFKAWATSQNPEPYHSIGNGAAMRISPVAYVARDLDELKTLCYKVTSITHNSEEALIGAEAVASAIFLARKGYSKSEIEKFITTHYYKLDYDLDSLQKYYKTYLNCKDSCPQAIFCFLEGNTFEDVIKTAISIGGDSDTIAAIAGSIACEFFPVLNSYKEKALSYLTDELKQIYYDFDEKIIKNS